MAKKEKKFIQKAIKRPGALTRKAHAAGESVSEFARKEKNASGRTGRQARFYEDVLKPASKRNASRSRRTKSRSRRA